MDIGLIKDTKFIIKLALLLLLPVGATLYFSSIAIVNEYQKFNELATIQKLTKLSMKSSALIHEVQKERGMSSLYLGANGKSYSVELGSQRGLTDKAFNDLSAFVKKNFYQSNRYVDLRQSFMKVENFFSGINFVRSQIDTVSMDTKDAVNIYTKVNENLFGIVETLIRQADHASMYNLLFAYVNFLHGKEYVGLERAVVANTLARQSFVKGFYDFLLQLQVRQKVHFENFKSTKAQKILNLYNDKLAAPFFEEVDMIKNQLIERKGTALSVSPDYWFKISTDKINELYDIEKQYSNYLGEVAAELKQVAMLSFLFNTCVISLFLLLTGFFLYLMLKYLDSSVQDLKKTMGEIIEGKLDARASLNSGDEFGEIASKFNTMIEILKSNKEKQDSAQSKLEKNALTLSKSLMALRKNAIGLDLDISHLFDFSEKLYDNFTNVNAATEEMISRIEEIYDSTYKVTDQARYAVTNADESKKVIEHLRAKSDEVDDILQVVSSIANQSKILALNATIEAVSAGDAGKGFVVVANEVKSLAKETQEATNVINRKIHDIQDSIKMALSALSTTTHSIELVNSAIVNTSEAIKEQSTFASRIGENMKQSYGEVDSMRQNVKNIQELVKDNSDQACEIDRINSKLSNLI